MDKLPLEIWHSIYTFLSYEDVIRVGAVCQAWSSNALSFTAAHLQKAMELKCGARLLRNPFLITPLPLRWRCSGQGYQFSSEPGLWFSLGQGLTPLRITKSKSHSDGAPQYSILDAENDATSVTINSRFDLQFHSFVWKGRRGVLSCPVRTQVLQPWDGLTFHTENDDGTWTNNVIPRRAISIYLPHTIHTCLVGQTSWLMIAYPMADAVLLGLRAWPLDGDDHPIGEGFRIVSRLQTSSRLNRRTNTRCRRELRATPEHIGALSSVVLNGYSYMATIGSGTPDNPKNSQIYLYLYPLTRTPPKQEQIWKLKLPITEPWQLQDQLDLQGRPWASGSQLTITLTRASGEVVSLQYWLPPVPNSYQSELPGSELGNPVSHQPNLPVTPSEPITIEPPVAPTETTADDLTAPAEPPIAPTGTTADDLTTGRPRYPSTRAPETSWPPFLKIGAILLGTFGTIGVSRHLYAKNRLAALAGILPPAIGYGLEAGTRDMRRHNPWIPAVAAAALFAAVLPFRLSSGARKGWLCALMGTVGTWHSCGLSSR